MTDNNLGGWALDEMWWLGKAPGGSVRASEAGVGRENMPGREHVDNEPKGVWLE